MLCRNPLDTPLWEPLVYSSPVSKLEFWQEFYVSTNLFIDYTNLLLTFSLYIKSNIPELGRVRLTSRGNAASLINTCLDGRGRCAGGGKGS